MEPSLGARYCSIKDYETTAKSVLSKNALGYYASGACAEYSLKENKEAFKKFRIRPRFMRNVRNRTTRCVIQGTSISAPIGVAPTAMQKMAHPEGECANARAVGKFGSIFILSTLSTSSIEEVAAASPDTIKWFQLYVYKDRSLTIDLVKRAEKNGFKALVLTVDASVFGKRYADVKNNFQLPPHLSLCNFKDNSVNIVKEFKSGSAITEYIKEVMDDSLTWKDVKWLRSITSLPIILKGILTAEDALIGLDTGISGIIVSNHGARQLDSTPASIEALPEIVNAVGQKCEVYLDGGISYGSDIFKALALGAKMVFVGRPAIWGLACNGEAGVKHVLDLLGEEFNQTLALTGCSSVGDIRNDMVVHESYYSHL